MSGNATYQTLANHGEEIEGPHLGRNTGRSMSSYQRVYVRSGTIRTPHQLPFRMCGRLYPEQCPRAD
jgi:hypothetical protein